MSERIGDWIQTAHGTKFFPLDPRPEEVDVRDVAHALSNVCRFAGHARWHYSVAQHSVLASRYAPPGSGLPALLHDAAEAYMGDIARPWKRFLYVKTGRVVDRVYDPIKDAERNLLDVILSALTCPPRTNLVWVPIEEIDMRMLATEARDLMHPLADEWSNTFQKPPCEARYAYHPYPEPIEVWMPGRAKSEFLARYAELVV